MRQTAKKRAQSINGQIGAACRRELEWLRIDLLEVWAAPRFDVDAYARIRYQIRLLIDAARVAGEPPSSAIVSLSRRAAHAVVNLCGTDGIDARRRAGVTQIGRSPLSESAKHAPAIQIQC